MNQRYIYFKASLKYINANSITYTNIPPLHYMTTSCLFGSGVYVPYNQSELL